MNSVALALLTFGVCLAVLLVAMLAGEVIYHWVYPHLFNKPFSKGSKIGDKEYPQEEEGALYIRRMRDYWPPKKA